MTTRAAALAYHAALRDWKEDFAHENGSYQCSCCICDQEFFGHKRRHVCKLCASIPPDSVHPKNSNMEKP